MNYNQFSRMWHHIGQHAYADLRSEFPEVCKGCIQEYDSYGCFGGSSCIQGEGICGGVRLVDGKWNVCCGYGSDFDMSRFEFVKDFPAQEFDGLCDWCIRRMLNAGCIVLMSDGMTP